MEVRKKTKDDYVTLIEKKVHEGPGYFARITARRDKETNKVTLSVYRPLGNKLHQNISFGKRSFMHAVFNVLQDIEKKVGWRLTDAEVNQLDLEKSLDLEADLKVLKQKDKKNKEYIKQLSNKINQQDLAQVVTTQFNGAFTVAHKQFKEKIDGNNEHEIQKFLSNHLWLISPEYYGQTKDRITEGGQYDFKVKKLGGFYDIIEIKKPKLELFKGNVTQFAQESPSKAPAIKREVKHALFQLMEYLERETSATQRQLGTAFRQGSVNENQAVFKPKGTLVIGEFSSNEKKASAERMLLRQFNSYLHGIEIITYTELLERSNLFAQLKETKVKRKLIKK
ncbi:MAG: Shedu anti-phage system protein SduA domain-containing protein [archaeon]